jgi:hypothetical protein
MIIVSSPPRRPRECRSLHIRHFCWRPTQSGFRLRQVDEAPDTWIPIGERARRILSESDIRTIGLALAADRGDPSPRLIQHVTCSRAEANRVTCDAVVPGERPSWLIAIQGRFSSPRPSPPRFSTAEIEEHHHSVITLVVDVETGGPTDGGSSDSYPDLADAGVVVTDYSAEDVIVE